MKRATAPSLPAEAAMALAWESVSARFAAYALLLPGDASFVCQASLCVAHCCRKFSVALGEAEVARMRRSSGLRPVDFLEEEDGEPITLPLAQPYLLARKDGQCSLLGDDLMCGQYEGRPDACRLYPHHVIFIDAATARPVHSDLGGMRASLTSAVAGPEPLPYSPVLIRHLECPGFTGSPLARQDWVSLLRTTALLQYSSLAPA
jgi:hypothetical protein